MKILRGTIFGGIFYFFLGWVVYGMLLMNYFSAHIDQSVNKPMGEMVWWAIIASNLLSALFLTIFLHRSKAGTIVDGLINGAIFGALFTAAIDLSFWSMTNMYDSLAAIAAEVAVASVVYALVGMVIVLTWGKEKD